MPASRKVSRGTKRNIAFSTLTDDNKKLQYYKSLLPHRVQSIEVRGKSVQPGDCVIMDIAGDDSGTSTSDDICIAEVLDIRSATNGDQEAIEGLLQLFVQVRWFYTGQMLNLLPASNLMIKNLSDFKLAPRELVLSDHTQVFPSSQLSRKLVIRKFTESSAEQPTIGNEEWWYRYFWATKQSIITDLTKVDKPTLACGLGKLCIKKHYAPHLEHQYYCPRDSCRTWYHRECLVKAKLKIKQPAPADRLRLMLQGTPGFEWLGIEDEDSKFFAEVGICVEHIEGIVACAQSSVMRGKEYGVVGRYQAIKRARYYLYEARKDSLWPSDVEIKEFVQWTLPSKAEPVYCCKKCGLAI